MPAAHELPATHRIAPTPAGSIRRATKIHAIAPDRPDLLRLRAPAHPIYAFLAEVASESYSDAKTEAGEEPGLGVGELREAQCGEVTADRSRRCVLFGLFWNIARRQRRALAEKEVFHVLRDQLLRFLLPGHEPVLIENHLHPLFPQPPGVEGDVLEDALPQLARPGRCVEPGHLLLELLAEHASGAVVAR